MSNSKKPINTGRRAFLGGAGVSIAGAAALGFAFSPEAQAALNSKTIVHVFLRGGMDGLNLVTPRVGVNYGHYEAARPNVAITPDESLPLGAGIVFGLHPNAGGLRQIFQENDLAIVQACGHPPGTFTRSHFDAQEQIELGTPGVQNSNTGWLSRYLSTVTPEPGALFTALVSSSNPPDSLRGWTDVATVDSTNSFNPDTSNTRYRDSHLEALRSLYASGNGSLDTAALAAVDAVELINGLDLDNYTPSGGASYPNNSLGRDMELIAKMIVQDLGVSVATVNIGGWDTHNQQAGGFANRIQELSDSLRAFHQDMKAKGRNNIAVIVQSEFGRQITENANRGTDHGLGNPMLVINPQITGGLYGAFPGIAVAQREADSLRPTTDFRRVLAAVTEGLFNNNNTDTIFNSEGDGFSYSPRPNWFI